MAERMRDDTDTVREGAGRWVRRISWGAIFAGAVVALVIQLMLNLLGLSIGLGAIDPATEQYPLSGIGTGAGIWLVISGLIALFAGGWTAGRLAGLPQRTDGVLHGFVAWAVTTFVTLYLVSSGVGTVLSGAFSVVEKGAQLVGQGIEAVAPGAGEIAQQVQGDLSFDEIKDEAYAILRETGRDELHPDNLARRTEQAADTARQAVGEAARSPSDARAEIEQAFEQLLTMGEDVVSEADREAAVNVLVSRTDMSRQEARQTVAEYENAIGQARDQLQQTAENVGERATEVSDDVLAAMSSAALWAFFSMLVGAAAAAAGGAAGAPGVLPTAATPRRH